MTNIDKPHCRNCRFWRPPWKRLQSPLKAVSAGAVTPDKLGPDGFVRPQEKGLCCRYAPTASALTTVWMETNAIDWCGDYELSEDDLKPRS